MNNYVLDLYQKLIDNCPVDTGNMRTNIYLYDMGDYVKISVETSYASYVNYNRQRTTKETANYQWIEGVLQQWAAETGGNIEYELS